MGRCRRKTIRDIISQFDPDFENANRKVLAALDLIPIAEEQIEEYCERFPEQKKYIWPSFKILRATDLFLGKEERIYRHHCKELLIRIVAGSTTELGTKAEVMLALSEMSLKAPLNQDYAALYFNLFDKIMGKGLIKQSNAGTYSYPGAGDEILIILRKKMFQDWRK